MTSLSRSFGDCGSPGGGDTACVSPISALLCAGGAAQHDNPGRMEQSLFHIMCQSKSGEAGAAATSDTSSPCIVIAQRVRTGQRPSSMEHARVVDRRAPERRLCRHAAGKLGAG